MDTEHPETIGNYDILGVLGKGAMGKVYKAAKPPQNKIVAIKVLPSEFMEDEERVERFNREAQAVALLSHRNVVRIVERGEEDGQHFFVMEYVPGTSLDAVLKQRRLSLPEAIRVFRGVCNGLEAAHKQSIVHRDLSPRNVLVSEDLSVVKIADFGISRIETVSREQGTLSTTEFSLGSLHYIAPEQARNMATADHRADIYSLGVLLYEMLTGRVPVGRFNLPSQINSEVPPEVDPIVLKCLEVNPQGRYPTVSRLLKEVARLEDQLRLGLVHEVRGIGSQTSKIFLKSTRGSRTTRIAWISVAALGLVGAAVIAFRTFEQPPEEPAPASDPVEVVAHERPEIPEPEVDPLAAALDGVAAPESDEPEATEDEPLEGGVDQETAAPRQAAASPAPAVPESPEIEQELEIAGNKLDAGLIDEAQADLEALIEEHPRAKLAPKAYLLLGKVHEEGRDQDKARATYVELQSRFPESTEAVESIYRSAKLLQNDKDRQSLREARSMLGGLAEQHPSSPWAPRALLEKAAIETDAKWTLRDPILEAQVPAALATYRDLTNRYPSHQGSEKGLWILGEMYSDLKEFELAVEAFEKLGSQYPSTKYEAWWSAGQIYDRRLDDDGKAVVAYRNVPATSRHHNDAQRRITKLTK